MELIFFALMLLIAAILYPEGTRALLGFVLKTTLVAAVVIVSVVLLFGLMSKADVRPTAIVAKAGCYPASVLTLDDGTKLDLEASCD